MQSNSLKKKEGQIKELSELADIGANAAEKIKEVCKERDEQIVILKRQLECSKKQIAISQNKFKSLTNGVVADITKQLDIRTKEVEMLKEMIKTSKKETMYKEKEIRRLTRKLGVVSQTQERSKDRFRQIKQQSTKSYSVARESSNNNLEEINKNIYKGKGNNYFFSPDSDNTKKVAEIGDMKDLGVVPLSERIKNQASFEFQEVGMLPELHLPSINLPNQKYNE